MCVDRHGGVVVSGTGESTRRAGEDGETTAGAGRGGGTGVGVTTAGETLLWLTEFQGIGFC